MPPEIERVIIGENEAPIYCFTRMLTWNAQKIVQVRCHRWDIEPLHERIQQLLGAEDSQLQTEAGVRRHLTRVLVVNSLLKSRDSESTHRGSAKDRVPGRVAHVWATMSSHPLGGVPGSHSNHCPMAEGKPDDAEPSF
jgi:hypothetical protein